MNPLAALTLFILTSVNTLGADFFFFRGKDADVPSGARFVRVFNHREQPVKGAKIVLSLVGKAPIEGVTDESGTVTFPRADVSRIEAVRCEIREKPDSPYVVTIAGNPRTIAWPVIFRLNPLL